MQRGPGLQMSKSNTHMPVALRLLPKAVPDVIHTGEVDGSANNPNVRSWIVDKDCTDEKEISHQ